MRIEWAVLVGATLLTAVACSATRDAESATPPLAATQPIAILEPVSASAPSDEAKDVLEACDVSSYGIDKVAGMAQVPHATDVWKYAPLTGLELELKSDAPAWVIQFSGELPMPKQGEMWIDPICVRIGETGGFYATGPVRNVASGDVFEPPAPARRPTETLPPLAP